MADRVNTRTPPHSQQAHGTALRGGIVDVLLPDPRPVSRLWTLSSPDRLIEARVNTNAAPPRSTVRNAEGGT